MGVGGGGGGIISSTLFRGAGELGIWLPVTFLAILINTIYLLFIYLFPLDG